MNRRIVGVFVTPAQAQDAVRELCSTGLDKQEIQVIERGQAKSAANGESGFMGKIVNWLLGKAGKNGSTQSEAYYNQEPHLGRTLLIVNAPDAERANRAALILREKGALEHQGWVNEAASHTG